MTIRFVETDGTWTGADEGGRCWSITKVFTGWRMEFVDAGDATPTYAGVHRSVEAAQAEAER